MTERQQFLTSAKRGLCGKMENVTDSPRVRCLSVNRGGDSRDSAAILTRRRPPQGGQA